MKLDLSPLENAVIQLEEARTCYHSDIAISDPRLKRHLRAAVIQAFEFTYELSFKMVRRYLAAASANPSELDSRVFTEIIRDAFKQDLVQSGLPAWKEYRSNRGATSHAYNEKKAQDVFEGRAGLPARCPVSPASSAGEE